MNEEFNPFSSTTVVVEEKKRRKAAALWIAGGAAALLVAGGSTFALWQDTSVFTGGTITAGNLDLQTNGQTQFFDVSRINGEVNPTTPGDGLDTAGLRDDEKTEITDASGNDIGLGHVIDPSTWRIVPGDTVAAVYNATVVLKGDNLVADLKVSDLGQATPSLGDTGAYSDTESDGVTPEPTSANNSDDNTDSEVPGTSLSDTNGFTDSSSTDGPADLAYNYVLYQDGKVLYSGAVPTSTTTDPDPTIATFTNSNQGQGLANKGGSTPVVALDGGSSAVTVVLTVNFNKDVQHRQDVTAAETLSQATLSLVQTRSEGPANS